MDPLAHLGLSTALCPLECITHAGYLFSDYYFTNLVWADEETVSVTWMDRAQTTSIVTLCKARDGHCIVVSGFLLL